MDGHGGTGLKDNVPANLGQNRIVLGRYPSAHLMQRKFLRPKTYFCEKCHQSFGYLGNLSRHRKACEGNFHLKCPRCDKTFYRQDVLKIHMQNKHGIDVIGNN